MKAIDRRTDTFGGRTSGLAGPLLALALAVAAAGCGNVTAGGVTGDTEVYMSGDADGSGAAPAPRQTSGPSAEGTPQAAPPQPTVVGAGLEGDAQVTASIYLTSAGGADVPLTPDGPVTVTLDLAGAQQPRVAQRAVTLGSYTGLRIVFTDVVATVTGGLEIGGVAFTGPVSVDLGSGSLTVERTLSLTVREDQTLAVLVDLDAPTWLDLLDPVTGTVAGADFAGAVGVAVR